MTALTAARRKKIPARKFALKQDGKEKYPVDTRGRAIAAKSYAKQELNKGKLSAEEYHHIVNKANIKLHNRRKK